MRILLARNSGFCFGVRRAVELAEQNARPDRVVYTYGRIIHNQSVVEELRAKGVLPADSLEELSPGDTLIVRAHGAPPELYRQAEEKGIHLVDATCPFVKRIHSIVRQEAASGRCVLIAGQASHPEVAGIRGWAGPQSLVLEGPEDAAVLPRTGAYCLVAQTTLPQKSYDAIRRAVCIPGRDVSCHQTICDTTRARQDEAAQLSRQCTKVLVIGSGISANTEHLASICRANCSKTQTVERIDKLFLDNLQTDDIIGVVAGASTPDRMIREVLTVMSELEKTTIETVEAEAPAEAAVATEESTQATEAAPEAAEADELKTAAKEAVQKLGEVAQIIGERVSDAVEAAADKAEELTDAAKDKLTQVKQDVENQLTDAKYAVKDKLAEAEKAAQEKAQEESSEFAEAFEKTMTRIRNGQVIEGTVISIVDGEVFVNIGYKSDGFIPKSEFSSDPDVKPEETVKEGDAIDVEVLKVNDGEGNVLLSRKNVEGKKVWDELMAQEDLKDQIFEAVGKEAIKGGIIADLKGIRAFVPASQVSTKYVENLSEFVGKPMRLKVLEVDKDRKRIVASQKQVMLADAAAAKKEKWNTLVVGSKVNGVVRRITDFGAFVDIGGIDGLVHVTDAAWGRVKHPSDVFSIGQEIEVLILSVDPEKERVSLGYKQLQPKPWTTADQKYPVDSIVEGKVVRIVPFGAFVALESTIDGLIHISQVDVHRVVKVEDVLNVGDTVRCKVLEVNTEAKRISLSRKEAILDENPEVAEQLAAERAERDRQYAERQEQRQQQREHQQAGQQRRERSTTERSSSPMSSDRGDRSDRRRRSNEDGDYDLPPVQSTTTSLADLFQALKNEEEK